MEATPADHRIEQIRFANGTVWNAAAIASRTIAGTQNTITGTSGNDVFAVDHADDVVNEAANAGDDTIQSSVSYALRRNVERLTLTGFVDLNAWSTPGNPTSYLTGNAGNNVFNGPGRTTTRPASTVCTDVGRRRWATPSWQAAPATTPITFATPSAARSSRRRRRATTPSCSTARTGTATSCPPTSRRWSAPKAASGSSAARDTGPATRSTTTSKERRSARPGTALANVIDGGAGADTMVGFDDNDRFIVDNAGDVVIDKGVFSDGTQASTE